KKRIYIDLLLNRTSITYTEFGQLLCYWGLKTYQSLVHSQMILFSSEEVSNEEQTKLQIRRVIYLCLFSVFLNKCHKIIIRLENATNVVRFIKAKNILFIYELPEGTKMLKYASSNNCELEINQRLNDNERYIISHQFLSVENLQKLKISYLIIPNSTGLTNLKVSLKFVHNKNIPSHIILQKYKALIRRLYSGQLIPKEKVIADNSKNLSIQLIPKEKVLSKNLSIQLRIPEMKGGAEPPIIYDLKMTSNFQSYDSEIATNYYEEFNSLYMKKRKELKHFYVKS